jgi:predicted nuclease of restriction endonuclease-like (RecB) superfamily
MDIKHGYTKLLTDISGIITKGRKTALRQIDITQVITYWLVGRRIVEFYQKGKLRAEYGQQLLFKLSADLTAKHGRGLSERNLEMMRMFYLQYPISQTLSAKSGKDEVFPQALSAKFKLSWSHYCELLKEDNLQARSFYEIEASENGWSMRELRRQMDSLLYERLCLSKDKNKVKELSHKGNVIEKPEDAIKDPYILEFLGLKEETAYTETQLEQAIIDRLQHFLLEMGKGFTFVARQRLITLANRHYHIDLVLYNRFLKCFVLVDFKRGELTHADAGQMNFYLNYFRENETTEGENPPIGIILCSKKDEVSAKYILGNLNNKVFASKYKLALPTEKELDKTLSIKE